MILAVVSSDGYRRFHVFAMVASSSPALRGISLGVTAKILQILGDPSTGGVVFKNSRNFMVQIWLHNDKPSPIFWEKRERTFDISLFLEAQRPPKWRTTPRVQCVRFSCQSGKTISGFHSSQWQWKRGCRPILAISLTTNRERNAEPQQTPSCIIFSLYPDL